MHSIPGIEREKTKETTLDPGGVKEHMALFRRIRPRGLLDPPWVTGGADPFRKGGGRPSLDWAKGTHGSLPRDLAVSPMAQSVAKGASPVRIRAVSRHGTQA
ncbi:hypothetical protein CRG98_047196 [Punica granatum]|uniref:Uncharacterized protein n=1 Tax=Punica granatum TaxID=22663 RepID=A0A2I0HLF6_PUNGR|nr:hypothetical protein CRG98_047196 [Punica granatum]